MTQRLLLWNLQFPPAQLNYYHLEMHVICLLSDFRPPNQGNEERPEKAVFEGVSA